MATLCVCVCDSVREKEVKDGSAVCVAAVGVRGLDQCLSQGTVLMMKL